MGCDTNDCKGLIVFDVDVYQLPPYKAEELCSRLLETLKSNKPEGWKIVVYPVRNEGNDVRVFSFNGEQPSVIPSVRFNAKELIFVQDDISRDQLKEFALLMVGAPVIEISDEVSEYFDDLVDTAFRYEINRKTGFVGDCIANNGAIKVINGKCVIVE